MADAAQQSGRDRLNGRDSRLRAGLSEAEGAVLETVALQCESDVAAQDAKAKAIIDQFHAQSSRLVNPSFLPEAPPQLDALWQDRNNIVLRARDSLRSQLGEESFSIFDQFVREATSASVTNPDCEAVTGSTTKTRLAKALLQRSAKIMMQSVKWAFPPSW